MTYPSWWAFLLLALGAFRVTRLIGWDDLTIRLRHAVTGMGDDGAQGLLELKRAGGATYAQDEQTSVVFGMPQAAHACGAARALLPLESIAPAILELCRVKPGSTAAARPRG